MALGRRRPGRDGTSIWQARQAAKAKAKALAKVAEKDQGRAISSPPWRAPCELRIKRFGMGGQFGGKGAGAKGGSKGSVGKGSSDAICYKCGKTGHIARNCTNPATTDHRDCYKCGKNGHIARDCKVGSVNQIYEEEGGAEDCGQVGWGGIIGDCGAVEYIKAREVGRSCKQRGSGSRQSGERRSLEATASHSSWIPGQ